MINEIKKKYILFILLIFFVSDITIMLNSSLNLVYTKDINTSLSTYENSTYSITIKYPHSWSIDESGGIDDTDVDIVTFSSPSQYDNATVDIHQDKLESGNSDIGTYLKSEILFYNDNLDNFKVFDSNINSSLGGNNAYKLIYTYADDDGQKFKDMEIGTVIGNKVYYIAYDVEESLYDSYLPIVQNMIDSFKITLTNSQR